MRISIPWAIFSGLSVLLMVLMIVTGYLSFKNVNTSTYWLAETPDVVTSLADPEFVDPHYPHDMCNTHTFINIVLEPSIFSLIDGGYTFRATFQPCGDLIQFSQKNQVRYSIGGHSVLSTPLSVFMGTKEYPFVNATVMQSQQLVGSFDAGQIGAYPLDFFEADSVVIAARYKNGSSIPLQVAVTGSILSFQMNVIELDAAALGIQNFILWSFTVQRSAAAMFFSFLVAFIMWLLGFLSLMATASIWIRKRKVDLPILAYQISLLFALPGIRNSQAGSPPLGCYSDLISFFWAVAIVSFSAASLVINFIYTYNDTPAPPKPSAPAKKSDVEAPAIPVTITPAQTSYGQHTQGQQPALMQSVGTYNTGVNGVHQDNAAIQAPQRSNPGYYQQSQGADQIVYR